MGHRGHTIQIKGLIELSGFHLYAAAPRMPRQLCCGVHRPPSFDFAKSFFSGTTWSFCQTYTLQVKNRYTNILDIGILTDVAP